MNAAELLTTAIKYRLPGATVSVDLTLEGKYKVNVVHPSFGRLARADREAVVYSALNRIPFQLLSKITSITAESLAEANVASP